MDAIAPGRGRDRDPEDLVQSVFISTNIDYVLRNLGMRYLILSGVVTDQCIESAVRDACDLGYLVTVATDACTTISRSGTTGRCAITVEDIAGRSRLVDELVREIDGLAG